LKSSLLYGKTERREVLLLKRDASSTRRETSIACVRREIEQTHPQLYGTTDLFVNFTPTGHIAPLGWEHINLIGKYQFAPQPGRSLENLRPLRLKEQKEGEETPQEAAS
jgi:hypothetical protein